MVDLVTFQLNWLLDVHKSESRLSKVSTIQDNQEREMETLTTETYSLLQHYNDIVSWDLYFYTIKCNRCIPDFTNLTNTGQRPFEEFGCHRIGCEQFGAGKEVTLIAFNKNIHLRLYHLPDVQLWTTNLRSTSRAPFSNDCFLLTVARCRKTFLPLLPPFCRRFCIFLRPEGCIVR